MNQNQIDRLIRERLNPSIFQWDYLGLFPLLKNVTAFSYLTKREHLKTILDLGCGTKPYKGLFRFATRFVGFDIKKGDRVDVVGVNWDLPFQDNEFDVLISTQVLEHTMKIPETIKEMRRVVKNRGLLFVSVPLTFPEHGAPYDYYRFTRYGLMEIFKDFEIIEILAHNGYLSTLLRLVNTFFINFPFAKYLFFPIFLFNNIVAIVCDRFALWLGRLDMIHTRNFYEKVYMSLTESYSIILRNKK